MKPSLLKTYVALLSATVVVANRARQDRGEGVISAAIAVLIMAFLGAAMWLAFKGLFDTTARNTTNEVDKIGR